MREWTCQSHETQLLGDGLPARQVQGQVAPRAQICYTIQIVLSRYRCGQLKGTTPGPVGLVQASRWTKGVFAIEAAAADLAQIEAGLLNRIRQALPILSDLSRSDILLYLSDGQGGAVVTDQARPHSIFPVREQDLVGHRIRPHDAPWVFQTLSSTHAPRGPQSGSVHEAPIKRECLPVVGSDGSVLAALCFEVNLLAYERHRRRNRSFQRAMRQLQHMVARGELAGAAELSPFGEHDGIVLVDLQRKVQYTSGIATNLYRRIGYMGDLVGHSVYELETGDAQLVDDALASGACVEQEKEEQGRIWIRKALPIYGRRTWRSLWSRDVSDIPAPPDAMPVGVLLTVHDATEARSKEQELKAKMAMIQEIHHRVKNNLQVIASLLRLQARRSDNPDVNQALSETVNRILSVAVVHEFLSHDSASVINLREVAQRIIDQMVQSVMDPRKSIQFSLTGPTVFLTSQQATACALVINELLLNAVEHGYEHREAGLVTIELVNDDEMVSIIVGDDGTCLPAGFDLQADGGLGLRIVQTLVEGDLKGTFALLSEGATVGGCGGVKAVARFPKISVGGIRT